MDIAVLICCAVIIVLLVLILIKLNKPDNRASDDIKNALESLTKTRESENRMILEQSARQGDAVVNQLDRLSRDMREARDREQRTTSDTLGKLGEQMNGLQRENRESLSGINTTVTEKLDARLNGISETVVKNMSELGKNLSGSQTAMIDSLEKLRADNADSLGKINDTVNQKLDDKLNNAFELLVKNMNELGSTLRDSQGKQEKTTEEKLDKLARSFDTIRNEINATLIGIRNSNTENMDKLRRENQESLDKINSAVNEKLQKTLDDKIAKSFETVNNRLREVYEGLGEMKNVASGVSDLKNVLSNVKTRGILGEIQLGAILSEILTSEQYGEQIQVSPESSERVDFAVKLPGQDENGVFLPIDSKFPGDTYTALQNARRSGDSELVKSAEKTLVAEIRRCAKSICDKYIRPPYTTDFSIMFLPFEGLYAEVVNLGLIEPLQRDFRVNIAGPSTMAAMLNSLRMGFATLAIQKQSSEVWRVLGAAKTEFGKFEEVLLSVQKRLRGADEDLNKLVGTRTNAINKKLASVDKLDLDSAANALNE